jgi:amino acid transporter
MPGLDWLLGKRLSTLDEDQHQIGPWAGIPVLGLDALSSAAYGPEAALTVLIPVGALGLKVIGPLSALIVGVLLIVFVSYRQTISAYPGGGGSYTVAKQNLGARFALVAGAALALDYILNVAVGISAGVGALVSAVPALQRHTLSLGLVTLGLLTVVNLRGVRESGNAFMLPTYAFVVTLGVVVALGLVKTIGASGHPVPVVAPPRLASAGAAPLGVWLVARAFANGCTAMTGVEAVSNGVPLFRPPRVRLAQRTLGAIIAILVVFLLGIALLTRAYGIGATEPGAAGYQSILSMLVAAVTGRGAFYYLTMGSVGVVLALSANTSFADFPRLCRVLAEDGFLPDLFAVRGRRLVFSSGIVTLAALAGGLLVGFGGVTDRLIPLFAIGALLAFTLSQAGMVLHWRRRPGRGSRRSGAINGLGACATGITLLVVAVSKFVEGAWLVVAVIPGLAAFFSRVNGHYQRIASQVATIAPLEIPDPQSPIVVVPAASWNRMTQHGLKFALRLSTQVHVVQVKTETDSVEDLADNWELLIASRARAVGIPAPILVRLTSEDRRFFKPFVDYVLGLERDNPSRDIVVVIPDVILRHWYEGLLHNNRGAFLRSLLRSRGGSRLVIVDVPYHIDD